MVNNNCLIEHNTHSKEGKSCLILENQTILGQSICEHYKKCTAKISMHLLCVFMTILKESQLQFSSPLRWLTGEEDLFKQKNSEIKRWGKTDSLQEPLALHEEYLSLIMDRMQLQRFQNTVATTDESPKVHSYVRGSV